MYSRLLDTQVTLYFIATLPYLSGPTLSSKVQNLKPLYCHTDAQFYFKLDKAIQIILDNVVAIRLKTEHKVKTKVVI